MTSTSQIIDLGKLYQRTFGSKPYVVGKDGQLSNDEGPEYKIIGSQGVTMINGELSTPMGSLIAKKLNGVEIWLPVRFYLVNQYYDIPYCVVKISGQKTIIKTPLSNRTGSVKEQYNIDDYKISLKGFLIGSLRDSMQAQGFPEDLINGLKMLYEAKIAVSIENALTNIFLTRSDLDPLEQKRVVITSIDFPEVQGGRKNVRPFVMEMESDTVFTLELE